MPFLRRQLARGVSLSLPRDSRPPGIDLSRLSDLQRAPGCGIFVFFYGVRISSLSHSICLRLSPAYKWSKQSDCRCGACPRGNRDAFKTSSACRENPQTFLRSMGGEIATAVPYAQQLAEQSHWTRTRCAAGTRFSKVKQNCLTAVTRHFANSSIVAISKKGFSVAHNQ